MLKYLFLALSGCLLFSCVPNRKLVYLQNDEEIKNDVEVETDSIIREHNLQLSEYRIQPLDILYVRFESLTSDEYDFFSKVDEQQQQQLGGGVGMAFLATSGILVDANGDLEYPVVGKINVSGLTVFEAQEKVQKIASEFIRDVIVRIRLLNFRFTVLGEVRQEQTVTSFNTRLTMMEAVGLAGGFGELADRTKIKVIRQSGDRAEVFYANLLDEDYIESSLYYVQQNDIIIVPPLKQRPVRRYFAENLSFITTTVSAITSIIIAITLFNE